ncbi:UvrD-helicase domain-containing protein [Candidatus Dojkabacteria bacterium]|uniref:DNA 3'-5' helicase n=1 Tax=Candidatus Dojkabacteria bacterium TaxID=2099670 RepID=A0A955KUP6_9BACT|nr:UvrD-helicase domain-containing protein [Candidatus Dojkabacteria bacterium]MCB9790815.1 UvrD-helicase domain-containing protein [Candidatus Nomurabacteria bacterium]
MPSLFDNLNPEQKKAVEHTLGPLLVFAGAGSGKTRVITYRIANLIAKHNVDPTDILAVTFTKKASEEMQQRIEAVFNELKLQFSTRPLIGTFHSICALILRSEGRLTGLDPNFSIYDTDDSVSLVKELMLAADIDIKQFQPKMIYSLIGSAKNDMISPKDYSLYNTGYVEDIVARIYPEYQSQLGELNAVDFSDLLYKVVKIFDESNTALSKYQDRFKHILVDEYQDTNKVQYNLIKMLAQKHQNICVVGDDDQSIYKWRGADIRNIISFEKDFDDVTTVKLEQNYRSVKNVISAATAVIKRNNERVDKILWTSREQGEPVLIYQARDEKDEAQYVVDEMLSLRNDGWSLSDFAVLYRTNYQSRVIEEALLKRGIPYKLVGGFRFYDRKEVKDLLSYLRILNNLRDDVSLYRIINVPNRKMGPKSVAELVKLSKECGCTVAEVLVISHILLDESLSIEDFVFDSEKVTKVEHNLEKINRFRALVELFGSLYVQSQALNVLELIDVLLQKIKYIEFIDDGSDAAEMKKENVQELRNVAASYAEKDSEKSLNNFLQDIALIESEQERNKKDINEGAVTLMTLHSSKGLEFPGVFMIGMEEGIMPHSRSFTEPAELEEERRLCYVGITRAKERIWLTFTESRSSIGGYSDQIPSRFLGEIPQEICDYYSWNI